MKIPEEVIQRNIIELCSYLGLNVFKTSRVRKRCWNCGRFPAGGDGVTKGLPDLFVQPKPGKCGAFWLAIEVKGSHTQLSPEQKVLRDEGSILIIRDEMTFHELAKRLKAFEIALPEGVEANG